MMNQLDKDGSPHGPWEVYYDNGKIDWRGEYKHGKLHGLWEYYTNGQPGWKGEFKGGKRHGLWEFYHQSDGTIIYKGECKNNKMRGLWYDLNYTK